MINIIGNIMGTTGYDSHTRQLATALNKITKVRLSTQIPAGSELNLTNEELEMIKRKEEKDEVNLIITNPLHWKMNYGKRNWVYLVFEGDKIPKHFVELCKDEQIEKIIVPSNHTYRAVEVSMGEDMETIGDKLFVIPHGVDLTKFYPKEKENGTVVFFANKGLRNVEDRGGIQYLLKAYIEEFGTEDNVELFLKINPAYGLPDINAIVNKVTEKRENMPKISLNASNVKYDELLKFYHGADVFVSPTRAEAFNLPVLEAMACGLPIITTNFGGQTDFTNEETGWVIGGEINEVQHEIMYEGIGWLTPNIDELKAAMREALNKEARESYGKNGLEIAKKLTWDNSAKKIVELI